MFNGIEILDHKKEKENVVCHIPTLVMEFGFSTLQDNIKERFKKKKIPPQCSALHSFSSFHKVSLLSL